jgi:hypothetical protein
VDELVAVPDEVPKRFKEHELKYSISSNPLRALLDNDGGREMDQ